MHIPIENPMMILVACAIFTLIFMSIYLRNYILPIYYTITGGFRKDKKSTITPKQYRQVLVGAIYGRQQTAYVNSLKTGSSKAAEIANEWWGVYSHEEAIDKLDYLYNEGFNSLFPYTYKAYLMEDKVRRKEYLINNLVPEGELTEDEEDAISEKLDKAFSQMSNLRETYDELVKLKVIDNKEDLQKYGTVGWDAGRLSFFSRICYDMKYISESEAWEYQQKAYDLSKQSFTSWGDFAKSYVIGRAMWGGNDTYNGSIADFADELVNNEKSPWKEMAW